MKSYEADIDPKTPLLWTLRDTIGLTGAKYRCGIARCGVCTVHINGSASRSCSIPASAIVGKEIATIEGLAPEGTLGKVQQARLDHDVPRRGYCQRSNLRGRTATALDPSKT